MESMLLLSTSSMPFDSLSTILMTRLLTQKDSKVSPKRVAQVLNRLLSPSCFPHQLCTSTKKTSSLSHSEAKKPKNQQMKTTSKRSHSQLCRETATRPSPKHSQDQLSTMHAAPNTFISKQDQLAASAANYQKRKTETWIELSLINLTTNRQS